MSSVRLTINEQQVTASEGRTVLDVCRSNGIHVPTLCHHPALSDVGACRLCIVEIEGQRRPVPACTTPADEDMVIRTATPALEEMRRQTLELLFAERNHICPFCPMSGNCELQKAAYDHRIDHIRYDYCFPAFLTDNSHSRISLDHNRCILCTRCVRACDELIGAHVLDLDQRGSKSILIADNGVPLGESSCVSCGTCIEVCPTGALFEKRSAHWQGRLPLELTETICPNCGVGCRINVSVRHRQIGELRSAGGPNGNRVLCERGRFGLVEPSAPRITDLRVKVGSGWATRSLDNVLVQCARRLNAAPIQMDSNRVIALVTPDLPLETITACQSFLTRVVGSTRWSVLDRTNAPSLRRAFELNDNLAPLAGLDDLDQADMFLLLGCNLERSHGVVASYVRRAVLHRRAKLAKLNPRQTWLTDWTEVHLKLERGRDFLVLAAMLKYLIEEELVQVELPDDLSKRLGRMDDDDISMLTGVPGADIRAAARMYAEAERPMILCGRGLTRQDTETLRAAMNLVKATQRKNEAGRWRLMELAPGANSAGARLLGATELDINELDPHSADIAFVLAGEWRSDWPRPWIEKLRAIGYVIAFTAREHPVTEVAQVVVPSFAWAERGGTFVNIEGRVQKSRRLMDPLPGCVDERDFFIRLARAWRGEDCGWEPPDLPRSIRQIADGHMVPCEPDDRPVDLAGLRALVEG